MQRYTDSKGMHDRGESGAVAVEFALVLPILIMLLVGTITGGIAFSHSIGLTNAVREGARFGGTAEISSASWAQDVIRRTRETQFDDGGDAASSSTTVCVEVRGSTTRPPVCSSGERGTAATPNFGGSIPSLAAGDCVVLVYAARHFKVTLGVYDPLDGDIQRWSVARHERGC